jgi:hypothetical protein
MGRLFVLLLALVLGGAPGCRFDAGGLTTLEVESDLARVLDMKLLEVSTADAPQLDAMVGWDLPPPLDLLPKDAPAPPSCATILDPDTVMLLRFEKVTGFTFGDVAGTHDGVVSTKPSLVPGPPGCGKALVIPAAGGTQVKVPDHAAFKLLEGSVDFWVRFDAAASKTGFNGIISRDASGEANPGHLTIFRSCEGTIVARIQNTQDYVQCSAVVVPVGVWFHVGVNFGATTGLQLFVNGKQVNATKTITYGTPGYVCSLAASCNSTTKVGINGNSNPWVIGASAMSSAEGSGSPTSNPLAGVIDEVRVSKIPRTF